MTSLSRLRFAMCDEGFPKSRFSYMQLFPYLKEVGFDGVELVPYKYEDMVGSDEKNRKFRAKVRGWAEDSGIEVVALHFLLRNTEGLHLTSPNADVRERTAEYLVQLAQAAQELGAGIMVFGSPPQRNLKPGVNKEDAFRYAVDTFRQAMPGITRVGVTLCMEPLGPGETDFVNTCVEGMALVDAVRESLAEEFRARFMLHLDVKAMESDDTTPTTELIKKYGVHAGHFHLNTANKFAPGCDVTDFVPIFQALHESEYPGKYVSVEPFVFNPTPEIVAMRTRAYLANCVQEAMADG